MGAILNFAEIQIRVRACEAHVQICTKNPLRERGETNSAAIVEDLDRNSGQKIIKQFNITALFASQFLLSSRNAASTFPTRNIQSAFLCPEAWFRLRYIKK